MIFSHRELHFKKVLQVFVPTNTSGVERVTHTEGDKCPPTPLKCEAAFYLAGWRTASREIKKKQNKKTGEFPAR